MAWNYNNYNSNEDNKELVFDLRQTYAKLLENILFRLAEARINKKYIDWFEALDDLHTEINQKLDEDEKEVYNKELKKCVDILNQYPAAYNKQTSSPTENFIIKQALKDLELWLKDKMELKNMFGAKDMEDDGL